MTTVAVEREETRCPHCGTQAPTAASFCGQCGAGLGDRPHATVSEERRPLTKRAWLIGGGLAVLVTGVVAFSIAGFLVLRQDLEHERAASTAEAQDLAEQIAAQESDLDRLEETIAGQSTAVENLNDTSTTLSEQISALDKSLGALRTDVAESNVDTAALADRLLKSVFTIETPFGQGSGFAAWRANGKTHVLTANHVVEGSSTVTVSKGAKSWQGEVLRTDPVNDLAVISVPGEIAPPLWQKKNLGNQPDPGDELFLLGAPLGLEGSVTTGIVSRVAHNEIQTDASANPGSSGGPALDSDGNVVGVLVSGLLGGGGSVNFAVPIQRACVSVRHC